MLAALIARGTTGRGQHIDTSLFESALDVRLENEPYIELLLRSVPDLFMNEFFAQIEGKGFLRLLQQMGYRADLASNARPFEDRLRVIQGSVETFLSRPGFDRPNVVVLDPPRTG